MAIWLLHKHFDPENGEVFVESVVTADPPRTETSPIKRSAYSQEGLSVSALRFDAARDSGVGVIGMEFVESADLGSTQPVSDDDEPILAGIAERLRARGKTERFGVRLVCDPLGLGWP